MWCVLFVLPTLACFRFGGGLGFFVLGAGGVTSASLELAELSVEDSELALSVLEELVPSLLALRERERNTAEVNKLL